MGNGRLKRIAALTTLATTSVMVAGVVNVPALAGLPAPTVTTTVPTTTVPSTTVTVPSTPVTPPTTVTTPTVTTPTVKTPTVKTPTVKAPSGTTSGGSGGSGGGGGSGGSGGGGGGGTIQKLTSDVTGAVGGVTSGGSTSGSTSNTVSGVKGTVGGAAGGGAAGGGGTTAGGTNPALQALSAFDGGGGPGGTAGPGGSGSGSGPGGGAFGGPGGGGGGLPPTLSAAGGRRLRAALELLAECMSAIVPIDRQVLSMRAGGAGAAPLSRSQVASQLGVSTRQVRLSERRGLSGLRVAAEQTGCAGPVGGPFAVSRIGPLQLSVLATTSGVLTPATLASADGGGSPYVPARQAQPGAESPLARLTGNGGAGPAWLVVLVTVLLSVSIAGLMRELRHSVGP
jgi:hypothetical protein